jgi:hypothetical protein
VLRDSPRDTLSSLRPRTHRVYTNSSEFIVDYYDGGFIDTYGSNSEGTQVSYVYLIFAPEALGVRTTTLHIITNDYYRPHAQLTLKGTGKSECVPERAYNV